ncbi:MAG: response regulator [Thermoplasmata archaeon]
MDPAVTRVLVVDDNPGDARLVEYTLTHEPEGNFRCERVGRIAAAVERLGQDAADVVLLDLGLPDSQGTEGLRRIRSAAPKVPVVVLTGSEDPQRIRTAMAAGAEDFLVKGIFPRGYLARVIRGAILYRLLETEVVEVRPTSSESLRALSRVGTGVGVFGPVGAPVLNDAFAELTGISDHGAGTLPSWLSEIVGSASSPVAGEDRAAIAPSSVRFDVGEIVLDRATDGRVTLEYVVRRFPHLKIPRVLVFLREIALDRRAAGRRPPVGAPVAREAAPSDPAPADPATLDRTTWENLRELAGTDQSFLPSLVEAFLSEGRRLVGGLQSAVDAADVAAVIRLAHTLKSSCAQVGALGLSGRCATLEYQAETGNIPETRALILEIARDFVRVSDALKKQYPRF